MLKSLQLPKQLLEIENLVAFLALFVGVIAISFAAIFIKFSEAELSSTATVFNRLWIATLVLGIGNGIQLIVSHLKSEDKLKKSPVYTTRTIGYLLLLTVFYIAFQCTWAWSLTQTGIAISTLLHNLTPIFISLGAWLVFREKLERRFMMGMVLAIAGASELGLEGLQVTSGELKGDFAALISAVLYGGYILVIGQLRSTLNATTILMWSSLIGTVIVLPILLVTQDQLFPSSGAGWLAVIALALICHVIGLWLVIYSLDRLSASFVALFLVLDPFFTAVEAWIIFSESLSLLSWLALFISLFGIYLALCSQSIQKPTGSQVNE
ncbi:MAG: DMT family transporter [Microcoleaceae cyanobacterium]